MDDKIAEPTYEKKDVEESPNSIVKDLKKETESPEKPNNKKNTSKRKLIKHMKKLFFQDETKGEESSDGILADFLGRKRLTKLKRRAEVIKEKKFRKNFSFKQFFEVEAELGSDDEEHDDVVKKIGKDAEEEEDLAMDEDLKDLIANIEESDAEDIKDKYFSDMLERDKAEIKQIIRGASTKAKRNRSKDLLGSEEYLPLEKRMKRQKVVDGEDDLELSLRRHMSSLNQLDEAESENEEIKEMKEKQELTLIRKISEKSKSTMSSLANRIRENEQILKNVVNLNHQYRQTDQDTPSGGVFVKGNLAADTKPGAKLKPKKPNVIKSRYGHIINPKNSFLHAMKNDSCFFKKGTEGSSKSLTSTDSSASTCPIFAQNLNLIKSKASNLTTLFSGKGKSLKQNN